MYYEVKIFHDTPSYLELCENVVKVMHFLLTGLDKTLFSTKQYSIFLIHVAPQEHMKRVLIRITSVIPVSI